MDKRISKNTKTIIIEDKEVGKVKKILDESHIKYRVLNNASQQSKKMEFLRELAKLSPQEKKELKEAEKMMNSLRRARIKY